LTDPLVSTHFILFVAAVIFIYKGHYVPGGIIIVGLIISTIYHISTETCCEELDMICALLMSMAAYLSVFAYGGAYLEIIMGFTMLSLVVWYFAGCFYIGKNDENGRTKYPGNHPYYNSLHSIWHFIAFGSVMCCSMVINQHEKRRPLSKFI